MHGIRQVNVNACMSLWWNNDLIAQVHLVSFQCEFSQNLNESGQNVNNVVLWPPKPFLGSQNCWYVLSFSLLPAVKKYYFVFAKKHSVFWNDSSWSKQSIPVYFWTFKVFRNVVVFSLSLFLKAAFVTHRMCF